MSDLSLYKYAFVCNPKFFYERKPLIYAAKKIEEFYNDENATVCNISMPARFGKSYLGTILSAWLIMRYNDRIFRVSNEATLYNTFSRATQSLIQETSVLFFDEPKKIIGNLDCWYFGGSKMPSFFGGGVRGNITGFGATVAIFDDMYRNFADANSATFDNFLNEYKTGVAMSRLRGNKGKYKIFNIGTRWTVNDWFSKFYPDVEIKLPALVDGKTFCESWDSTDEILKIQIDTQPHIFAAQYMQEPTASGRQRLFENTIFEICEKWDEDECDVLFIADPATHFGSDYFTIGKYLVKSGKIQLIEMFAKQGATTSDVSKWLKNNGIDGNYLHYEKNGYGKEIGRILRVEHDINVRGFSTSRDKYSRVAEKDKSIHNYFYISSLIEPNTISLLNQQFKEFPSGEHDDIVDNVVMAFERAKL